ncbi:MAG TPA: ABC transporter permease subunit, partial [Symbiobacteriaceae bacterium]|nr:ABC transporter permease subunit [Symbiobacteriaceae bacterium]
MTPLQQIVRLWVSRLLWFTVVVAGLTFLLHLPAGITIRETGQRVEGLRIVRTYEREYHFDQAMAELRRYPADLLDGNILYKESAVSKGFDFLPVLRHDWLNSFKLYAAAVGSGAVVGVLVGLLVALRGRLLKSVSITLSVFSLSLPDFFVVLSLQFVSIFFWTRYEIKPFLVLAEPDSLKGWAIPLIVMALLPLGYMARLTASAMDDVMREDYIRTARSKGLHEGQVITGHAFRNAMPRVLAGLPALLNVTLSSLLVVER